jgi:transposase
MIPVPSGVSVWIATGHTDMRRGMHGLALVQESLKRDPHAGDLYIFRVGRGDLAKILWHDGIGLSLYAKRLDRGKRSLIPVSPFRFGRPPSGGLFVAGSTRAPLPRVNVFGRGN